MRRRPQPSRRRGFLRAAIAVVVLVVALVAVIIIVTSLTAPPANAPTPPTAPVPTAAPLQTATPTTRKGTATTRTVTPAPKASPTARKKKELAASGPRQPGPMQGVNAVASPGRRLIAFYAPGQGEGSHQPLWLRDRQKGTSTLLGIGDSFVRPVWSPDGRQLAYVTVQSIPSIPGARWRVMVRDVPGGRTRRAGQVSALSVTPLGWSGGHLLYLVATATDTSVYAAGSRAGTSILVPQPILTASLSPDGRHIAFGAPVNCGYCTLNLYNIDDGTLWTGPTGMPNEGVLAWTADGRRLVTALKNRIVTIDVDSHASHAYARPRNLPAVWAHPFTTTIQGSTLTLLDPVNGATYRAGE